MSLVSTLTAERAVAVLLEHLGYDPTSEELVDTPGRVVRALEELTRGERTDPGGFLEKTFSAGMVDHVVAVRGIEFVALCEHHLLPFTGTATVAYKPTPGGRVVGLSKLPRMVQGYAARLTMQERLTEQITAAMDKHLDTEGSACIIRSTHQCMSLRGVRVSGAEMVTSSLTGVFRDQPQTRSEFLALEV